MTVSINRQLTIGNQQFNIQRQLANEGDATRTKDLNPLLAASAVKAGQLTTRTDDDTGVITLAAGQGANFVAADRVDVYWDIGGVKGHRRGMKVSSVAGDLVTLGAVAGDIGAGDVFPAQGSNVILAKSVVGEIRFDGSDLVALAMSSEARAIIVLTGDDDVEDYFVHFPVAGATGWDSQDGSVNPVAGDTITKVYMSHADVAITRKVKAGAAYN